MHIRYVYKCIYKLHASTMIKSILCKKYILKAVENKLNILRNNATSRQKEDQIYTFIHSRRRVDDKVE